ncbi:MAG: phosphoglycerate dehydrogenase [Candidatus Latescibacterota bacterium]|nr:phosphoglycerate dehydrogenase [Candidatus Latescibacterota bacterium]
MKVLISDKVDTGCVGILEEGGEISVDVNTDLTPVQLLEVIGDYDGLIVRSATKVTRDVLDRATRLRAIGRAGAGVDNIDSQAATRRGVVVMNTPGGNSISTAEHAVSMMMALARNIPQASHSVKGGKWDKSAFIGVEMTGKTLGVFGIGQVGREVARRAAALGMRVLAYDPPFTPEVAQSYGAQLVSAEEIWPEADFLTFHLPLTDQTRHRLSTAELAQCKDGVRVINCARGGIVDEQALLEGLASGKVGGVAIDVFEQEPPPADSPLVAHERVICTPHLAASTTEAQVNVALQVAHQVREVLVDGVIRNAVNVPSIASDLYEKLRPWFELGECLGRVQGQLSGGDVERITVEYRGEVAGHTTSPLTSAVLKGIMESFAAEGSVNFVNAPVLAQERGIGIDELRSAEPEDYTSLISVIFQHGERRRVVSGSLFGKRDPRIVRFDDVDLDAAPEGHMLFYRNDDVPGIIGRIGTLLGSHGVNIAQLSLGRDAQGASAFTVLNVDSRISDELLQQILDDEHVTWARRVAL